MREVVKKMVPAGLGPLWETQVRDRRLHPVCQVLSSERFFVLVTAGSPKRYDLLRDKFDAQIILDRTPQAPYFQAHQKGLRKSKSDVGTWLHSMCGMALLVHFEHIFG